MIMVNAVYKCANEQEAWSAYWWAKRAYPRNFVTPPAKRDRDGAWIVTVPDEACGAVPAAAHAAGTTP